MGGHFPFVSFVQGLEAVVRLDHVCHDAAAPGMSIEQAMALALPAFSLSEHRPSECWIR